MDRLKKFFKGSKAKDKFNKSEPDGRLADKLPVDTSHRPCPAARTNRRELSYYEFLEMTRAKAANGASVDGSYRSGLAARTSKEPQNYHEVTSDKAANNAPVDASYRLDPAARTSKQPQNYYEITSDKAANSAPVDASYRSDPAARTSKQPQNYYEQTADRVMHANTTAQAASQRMNFGAKEETVSQRSIRLKATRELEWEKLQEGAESDRTTNTWGEGKALGHLINERKFEHPKTIQNVDLACEPLGDEIKLKKSEQSAERVMPAEMAAQAAYKRMNFDAEKETATQRNIRLRAMRELEPKKMQESAKADRTANVSGEEKNSGNVVDERNFEPSGAIQNVYFTCELLGDDIKLTRNEMRENVEKFLRSQLGGDGDAVAAASLMIFSLNGSKGKVASETLERYVQNVIEHPEDPKYRSIRTSNKAFQDRVLSAKGGLEFLLACGFQEHLEPASEGSSLEKFLVFSSEGAEDRAQLVQALEVLRTGEPVPLKLHRDPTVFEADDPKNIVTPKFSPEFYLAGATKVKNEQEAKILDLERTLTLRTQEMRLRDEFLRHYNYNYTLIRIRFPDNYFLQGTFSCYEKIPAVRDFICEHLVEKELALFMLKDLATGKMIDDETKTLGEMNLAPVAVLSFEWYPDVLSSYMAQGMQALYLDASMLPS